MTVSSPRTARHYRSKTTKEKTSTSHLVQTNKDVSEQPLRATGEEEENEGEEEEAKRKTRMPRIIRQTLAETQKTRFDVAEEEEEQVIVIGLDKTGQQPSEEQLTAIIQVLTIHFILN